MIRIITLLAMFLACSPAWGINPATWHDRFQIRWADPGDATALTFDTFTCLSFGGDTGKLCWNDTDRDGQPNLRFEGDAEESARIFFDRVLREAICNCKREE